MGGGGREGENREGEMRGKLDMERMKEIPGGERESEMRVGKGGSAQFKNQREKREGNYNILL